MRDRIKAYANGWYTVEREPEEFAAAARVVVERGYRALKLDPFGAGAAELERAELVRSVGLVEAVRGAVGPDAPAAPAPRSRTARTARARGRWQSP